jgi:hypothetical protein
VVIYHLPTEGVVVTVGLTRDRWEQALSWSAELRFFFMARPVPVLNSIDRPSVVMGPSRNLPVGCSHRFFGFVFGSYYLVRTGLSSVKTTRQLKK